MPILEKLADDLRNRLFFIPRGQKALQNPKKTYVPEHIENGEIDGGCVSPISSRAAVTYAHKSHAFFTEFTEGKDDKANSHSLMEIRNCQNPSIRHRMKVILENLKRKILKIILTFESQVIVVDAHHDFVILRSVDGTEIFDDYPHSLRPPKDFEWFLGFGLSHATENGQQITHRNGRICTIQPDYRGRFLASSLIDGGDSGGPCYSADRALIGIMVASTTTDPRLDVMYNREILKEEIKDASSNPADTWITPGHLINEAYMVIHFNLT